MDSFLGFLSVEVWPIKGLIALAGDSHTMTPQVHHLPVTCDKWGLESRVTRGSTLRRWRGSHDLWRVRLTAIHSKPLHHPFSSLPHSLSPFSHPLPHTFNPSTQSTHLHSQSILSHSFTQSFSSVHSLTLSVYSRNPFTHSLNSVHSFTLSLLSHCFTQSFTSSPFPKPHSTSLLHDLIHTLSPLTLSSTL